MTLTFTKTYTLDIDEKKLDEWAHAIMFDWVWPNDEASLRQEWWDNHDQCVEDVGGALSEYLEDVEEYTRKVVSNWDEVFNRVLAEVLQRGDKYFSKPLDKQSKGFFDRALWAAARGFMNFWGVLADRQQKQIEKIVL